MTKRRGQSHGVSSCGSRRLNQSGSVDLVVPGTGGFQRAVDVLDVLDALRLEPIPERRCALLRVDGDAVLPGGAAAEHAVEAGAGLGCQFQRLDEDRVRNAGREIDEWLVRRGGRYPEMLQRLGAGVRLFAFEGARPGDKLHL